MRRYRWILLGACLGLSLACNTVMHVLHPVDEKQINVHLYDASYYLQNDQYDLAIEQYTQALAIDPTRTDIQDSRAWANLLAEHWEAAAADYGPVIAANPSSASALNNRCWAYFQLGEYEKALPDCEQSIQLEPDDVHTLDSRARVYAALGHKAEAIQDFKRIIELAFDPELAEAAQVEIDKLEIP